MAAESGSGSALTVSFDDYADCRVVSVSGRVDHADSDAFLDTLTTHAEAATGGLVVDLSALDFITSAGLRALLLVHRTLGARKGRMAVTGVKGSVREVFRVSKFDTLLTVTDGVAEGVARVSDAAREAYPG